MPPHTFQKPIDLIKEFEGFRSDAYQDVGGIWTIGYGHTKGVIPGQWMDEGAVTELLEQEINHIVSIISPLITAPLNENQRTALISLVYNISISAFSKSTLLKFINKGDLQTASNEFLKWINVNKKVCPGLLKRRRKEQELFLC